ncbi:MAG: putative zinc-binding metallopeptidase [Spirochaetes bacterium]|jgi:hypothetical protein|nr:putative zinc-binding metallopeptidase [Spirochaetota bacterium]
MSDEHIISVVHGWDTVRFELLNTRISDLALCVEGSALEPLTLRLHRELAAKGIQFKPEFYLTDGWGCPDRVPIIGIPFYLADQKLRRLEEEQTGEIEDSIGIMKFLRHEAGHALNYAYRLWERDEWREVFGVFSKPYQEDFRPERWSRRFVRHIEAYGHGLTYAQKHPDEDFAETFAVWLTPRSGWRRKYRQWPAIRKLQCVDRLMKDIGPNTPLPFRRRLSRPMESMRVLLAEHYGQKAKRLRKAAQGYVDDKLRELFPPVRTKAPVAVSELLRRHHDGLLRRTMRWSGLEEGEVDAILKKLETRAATLKLTYPRSQGVEKIMDSVGLSIALAIEYATTGRFAG